MGIIVCLAYSRLLSDDIFIQEEIRFESKINKIYSTRCVQTGVCLLHTHHPQQPHTGFIYIKGTVIAVRKDK